MLSRFFRVNHPQAILRGERIISEISEVGTVWRDLVEGVQFNLNAISTGVFRKGGWRGYISLRANQIYRHYLKNDQKLNIKYKSF